MASNYHLSKQSRPHHYLTSECSIDQLELLRQKFMKTHQTEIPYSHFVVKAISAVLREFPDANAFWVEVSAFSLFQKKEEEERRRKKEERKKKERRKKKEERKKRLRNEGGAHPQLVSPSFQEEIKSASGVNITFVNFTPEGLRFPILRNAPKLGLLDIAKILQVCLFFFSNKSGKHQGESLESA